MAMRYRPVRPGAGVLAVVLIVGILAWSPPAFGQADVAGQWQTLPYTTPINPIHVAMLRTGRILIASGSENDPTHTTYRAAVYDPVAGTFAQQLIPWDLFCNAMSLLPDGRVLITGGNLQYSPFRGLKTTTVFDPATARFAQLQDMAHGRWYPSNLGLPDGSTMTFSGLSDTGGLNNAVELYHVPTGWSPEFAAPFVPALYPWLHLLPNGKVFLAGSKRDTHLFDPATKAWSFVAQSQYVAGTANGREYGSSVLLPLRPTDGYRPRVMIMGGDTAAAGATASAEIIDLGAPSPAWRTLPVGMSAPRVEMNAVILPTGKVLALGGSQINNQASTATLDADLFDPATETWAPAGRAAVARMYHSVALLLPDATVWVAGSNPYQGNWENRLEIYRPAYLFTKNAQGQVVPAPRPSMTSAPGRVGYGQSFQVATPNAADIADVVLVRPGSATHALNFEQRLVGLQFTAAGGAVTVTAPPTGGTLAGVAPPGWYMLFLINRAGTPSVARWIQLMPSATNQPPRGTITQPTGDVTITAGESVTFAGQGTDADGTVARFSWVFPGGAPATSTAAVPGSVTFATPGTYIASLTAVDDQGENDPSPPTRTITVNPGAFTASFTSPPAGSTVNAVTSVGMAVSGQSTGPYTYTLTVDGVQKFTETTAGTSTTYAWNTQEVAGGNHTLGLTARDSTGLVATATRTVTVDNSKAMSVAVTSPTPNQQVSGVTWATVWVNNGGSGPFNYTLSVGGTTVWQESSSRVPISLPWDTRATPDGPQTLTVTVRNTLSTASTSVPVRVANNGGGGTAMTASFTSPAEGATVSGTVPIGMSVSGGTAAYSFTLRIDGAVVLSQSGPATTASFSWNTAAYANGSHTLSLTVTDSASRSSTATRAVTVANGGGGGTLNIALTSPKPGQTVTGTVWATIWVNTQGTPPYTYTLSAAGATVWTDTRSATQATLPWETPKTPDGPQTLTVTVRDNAGRAGSASVAVVVQNGGGGGPAPLVAGFSSPADGATVASPVTVGMTAGGGTPSYTYRLAINGAEAFTQTTTATSTAFTWSPTANGTYTLALTVTDSAARTATASRTVTVANGGGGALTIALTSPRTGQTVSGTAWATIWVNTPGTAPYTYTLSAAGVTVWTETLSATRATLPWETGGTPNGPQTLTVTVRDSAGRTGTVAVDVIVQNP